MKQIGDIYCDYYFLDKNGNVFNSKSNRKLKLYNSNHYVLRTKEGKTKKVSLKSLYRLVYNENFCRDNIQSLEGEEWRFIEDTEQNYLISNKARVKSYRGYNATLISPEITTKGYSRITLYFDNLRVTKFLHRLVAEAFLGKPPRADYQVHHKNFQTGCNFLENLEWVSAEEHIKIHNERGLKANANCTKSKDNN